MSRTGAETKGQLPKPIGNLDLKERKRHRSPSDDAIKPKKLKCSELSIRTPKPSKSTIEHMKKYLNQASENDLDELSEYLLNRKRKRRPNTPLSTGSKSEVGAKVTKPTGVKQTWRREISQDEALDVVSPTIVRKISAGDLSKAHAELFPEDEVPIRKKKLKLTER